MKKISKYKLVTICSIFLGTPLSYATTSNTNMAVTSNLSSTCSISSPDYNFGILETAASVTQSMTVRCNKNTTITLTATSKTNPQGYSNAFMTKNAQVIPQNGGVEKPKDIGIRYYFDSSLVQNNASYTVVRRPMDNVFAFKILANYDYSMQLKLNTGDAINIPIIARVHSTYNSKYLVPGDYYDVATYTLEF
jgi:hypothetical protein